MISEPSTISSRRLHLVTLTPDVLRLSLSRDAPSVERRLELSVPPFWYEDERFIRMRLKQVTEDPSYLPWSVRAIALRAERQMIGRIGFHTKPAATYLKPYAPNGVEFGYDVFPPYRRRGCAREACRRVFESDTLWTLVRGSDLEEGRARVCPRRIGR